MEHEGMVHALEEIHRLLRPGGYLIDIHPFPEGPFIKALQGGRVLFAEPEQLTDDEDVLHAEEGLAQIVDRGLFVIEDSREFNFLTYGSSVLELRDFREQWNAYRDSPTDEALAARKEELYAQVEEIMRASGEGAEVALHERGRIARLRPVR